jgi:hypothetical protein
LVIQNKDRISRALELLRDGLIPFVESELKGRLGPDWLRRIEASRERGLTRGREGKISWDSQALLKVMIDNWQSVFKYPLGHLERAWVGELLDVRNRFAHEQPFNADDTHRALDTSQRLLAAVSAGRQAAEVGIIKSELMHTLYAAQLNATNLSRDVVTATPNRRRGRKEIIEERVLRLTSDFEKYVRAFDERPAFIKAGQLENHVKTIQMRLKLGSVSAAIQSSDFLNLLRNTLASWGIGSRASLLASPELFAADLRKNEPALLELEKMRLDDRSLPRELAAQKAWALIESLEIVGNKAKLVPGTKALHHLLPDLIVPMDREYTRTFLGWHGQEFQYQQERIFHDAFNKFATLATTIDIRGLVGIGWRTSITKLIDNALVAFCRLHSLKRPS